MCSNLEKVKECLKDCQPKKIVITTIQNPVIEQGIISANTGKQTMATIIRLTGKLRQDHQECLVEASLLSRNHAPFPYDNCQLQDNKKTKHAYTYK